MASIQGCGLTERQTWSSGHGHRSGTPPESASSLLTTPLAHTVRGADVKAQRGAAVESRPSPGVKGAGWLPDKLASIPWLCVGSLFPTVVEADVC